MELEQQEVLVVLELLGEQALLVNIHHMRTWLGTTVVAAVMVLLVLQGLRGVQGPQEHQEVQEQQGLVAPPGQVGLVAREGLLF